MSEFTGFRVQGVLGVRAWSEGCGVQGRWAVGSDAFGGGGGGGRGWAGVKVGVLRILGVYVIWGGPLLQVRSSSC